jgi:hypothetical protein
MSLPVYDTTGDQYMIANANGMYQVIGHAVVTYAEGLSAEAIHRQKAAAGKSQVAVIPDADSAVYVHAYTHHTSNFVSHADIPRLV